MTAILANSTGDMPVRPPYDELEYQAGPPIGDATRHLCSAAYQNRYFRDAAIEELVVNGHRVPAPAPGIDQARVLYECLRARREALAAAFTLWAVTVIGLVISPASTIAVLGIGALGWVVRRAGKSLLPLVGRTMRMDRYSQAATMLAKIFDRMVIAGFLGVVLVVGLLGTVFGGATTGIGLLFPIIGWIAVGTVFEYRKHQLMAALHRPQAGRMRYGPRLAPVFTRLTQRQAEAETVYSNYKPFIGCGVEFDPRTLLAMELVPSTKRREANVPPEPLDVPGLHARVTAGLLDLTAGTRYPGDVLRRMTVNDRVFRSGNRWERPGEWLGRLSQTAQSGRSVIAPTWANALDDTAHERIRHYIEARAELWQEQVVVTMFVRVSVQGSQLYVEGLPFVLPPIAKWYHQVDAIAPPDPLTDGFGALGRAVIGLPDAVVNAGAEPARLVGTWVRTWLTERWYRRMQKAGVTVDHGPTISLRAVAADTQYQQYFQHLDVSRFISAVEMRVASVLVSELKRAGYDIGELEQNNFVNYGSVGQMGYGSGTVNHRVGWPGTGHGGH